jgi:hypothetical protein
MEITAFGYIFLPICVLGLFLSKKYLFAVTTFACIFQTTYVFIYSLAGPRALFTWLLALLFFIVKSFSLSSLWTDIRKDGFLQRLTFFAVFAVLATLLLPHFQWDIQPGFDMLAFGEKRTLSFGGAHVRHIVYVGLFFLSLYLIYKNRAKFSSDFVEKIFVAAVIAVCVIGLWEFLSKSTDSHTFPYTFLYNNPSFYGERGYMQGLGKGLWRLNSTFMEPSLCGGFLAASFWAIMTMEKLRYKWLCILVGLTLMFNLSGTGVLSFFAGFPIFLLLKNKGKYVLWMLIVGLLLAVIIYEMDYFEKIIYMLTNKKDSGSGIVRGAAAWYSWEVFVETMGIGVGMGGLRGGSFLLSMLATLGVVGTFLFGRIYYYIFKHLEEKNKWLTAFALVLLVAQTIALPDFTYSSMWMYFFMATALLPSASKNTSKVSPQ